MGTESSRSRTRHSPSNRSPSAENSASQKPRVRPIGSLISQLMSRRGYAQLRASEVMQQHVAAVLDPHLRDAFQVGALRSGVLQIYATDSVTLQELNFRKRAILKQLQQTMPESRVSDVRFRIQT